ncbi:hypothetical protein POTOM_028417 [Populus tomentosa]|uniref:Uncharacterized protein n=1 Tax=Populus tomentosa TaxID=118781 RepID=A0A8X8CVR5_POPTO|nr:hypothetical protein POTOM_028417 [Populus tomentosa]
MEKSKSFSGYSNAYSEIRLGFEERSRSYSFNGPAGKVDDIELESSGNPELKRRKRVAQYNMYTMEGKIKSSLRNSFKWIKSKLTVTKEEEKHASPSIFNSCESTHETLSRLRWNSVHVLRLSCSV